MNSLNRQLAELNPTLLILHLQKIPPLARSRCTNFPPPHHRRHRPRKHQHRNLPPYTASRAFTEDHELIV